MREGVKKMPQQIRFNFFSRDGSCALGAAAEGAGYDPLSCTPTPYEFLKETFHEELGIVLRPTCRSKNAGNCGRERPVTAVYSLVKHLNDDHELTREEIADCLEAVLGGQAFTCSDGTIVEPAKGRGEP
jgi:hypothetical protein